MFLILKSFNNSTFFNVVCISWKLKCWMERGQFNWNKQLMRKNVQLVGIFHVCLQTMFELLMQIIVYPVVGKTFVSIFMLLDYIQGVSRLQVLLQEVISQVFVMKKVHINMRPILDGYGVMTVF